MSRRERHSPHNLRKRSTLVGFIEGLVDVEMLRLTVHVVPRMRQMNVRHERHALPGKRDGAIQLKLEVRSADAARSLPPTVHVDFANAGGFHFPSVRFFGEYDDFDVLQSVVMNVQNAVLWFQRFV